MKILWSILGKDEKDLVNTGYYYISVRKMVEIEILIWNKLQKLILVYFNWGWSKEKFIVINNL